MESLSLFFSFGFNVQYKHVIWTKVSGTTWNDEKHTKIDVPTKHFVNQEIVLSHKDSVPRKV